METLTPPGVKRKPGRPSLGPRVGLAVLVPEDIRDRLHRLVAETGASQQHLLLVAITRFLDEHGA